MTPQEVLELHFPLLGNGRDGLVTDMPMDEYRAHPGFAPSDLKKMDDRLGSPKSGRGHPLRLLRSKMAEGLDVQEEEERKTHLVVGSYYHACLLEPETIERDYVVLTEDIKEDLVATAKERKKEGAPQEFSFRLKEAQQWRKDKGDPKAKPSDEEAQQILEAAQARFVGEINFHGKLTEFEEWQVEQKDKGLTWIFEHEKNEAQRMVDAIFNLGQNQEVAEYLEGMEKGRDRVEVSMFLTVEMPNGVFIQLKGRPDILPRGEDILDPKTTTSVHPKDFPNQVSSFGYDISMGGYCWMSQQMEESGVISLEEATFYGFPKRRAGFLAQEKTAPYLAKIMWMDPQWLNYGASRYLELLSILAECYKTSRWTSEDFGSGEEVMLPPYQIEFEVQHAPNRLR